MERSIMQWKCPFCDLLFHSEYYNESEEIKLEVMKKILESVTNHICKIHKHSSEERMKKWLH